MLKLEYKSGLASYNNEKLKDLHRKGELNPRFVNWYKFKFGDKGRLVCDCKLEVCLNHYKLECCLSQKLIPSTYVRDRGPLIKDKYDIIDVKV